MPAKKEKLTFEQSLERLSRIADILENETPSLEEALALYEEGAALLKQTSKELKNAEAKITLLSKGESTNDVNE